MTERRRWGLLAEFESHETLVEAARRARLARIGRLDAYSPYPVEGLADAMGFTRTSVALITLVGGLVGAAGGYLMQYYLAVVDYPIDVGGRPLHSWPTFVPVTFELMVLFASVAAVMSLFVLNGLPRPHHPLFAVPSFARATQDRFFLSVEAAGPGFDAAGVRRFLLSLQPRQITDVYDE